MKIALSGVETNNKGAELMLYAILQAIERKFPSAIVYLPAYSVPQGRSYRIHTNLDLRYNPYEKINSVLSRLKVYGILRRLHIHILDELQNGNWAIPGCDYYFDASGFALSDQQISAKKWVYGINERVINYGKTNAKVIYLPQAVGPFERDDSREIILNHSKYVNLFFPRESVSETYLRKVGFDMKKVKVATDFTSTVEGVFPNGYEHLKGGVCVIPNCKMIAKGTITLDNYLKLLVLIIEKCKTLGKKVYILNHEGIGDEKLARECAERLNGEVEVVTGLNALEVKGIIGSAYLCITSRFHGVASSLNSCVPCLATSWSHKYAELFKDYGIEDMVLPIGDVDRCIDIVSSFLVLENNYKYRQELSNAVPKIKEKTKEMWKEIWNL